MSQITATITADCTLVSHLLDTCESLIAALRASTASGKEIVVPSLPSLTTVKAAATAAIPGEQSERLQHPAKWKDIDALVEQAIGEPEEWHSCFLDEQQRTNAEFAKIISRLKYVARECGIKLSIRRYLDEDDEGHFVHVQHGGAR